MNDVWQNVLIIVAISSMPLGFVMAGVLFVFIRDNKRVISQNRLDINKLETRVSVLESIHAEDGLKP